MTTYIPQITLPYSVFTSPAASILLPVGLGSLVGWSTARKPPSPILSSILLLLCASQLTWTYHKAAKKTKAKYAALKQPPYSPPAWVFGPAWTVLYGLMGYAAYRAVDTGMSPLSSVIHQRMTKHGATLYSIQLGLNLVWMPLFFGLKRPVEASVDILALVGINSYLTYLWGSVDRVAGLCLAPYVAWLSYASYLCIGAGYLNGWDIKDKETPKQQ
ncbi:translocator protein [Pyricularia oryzae Y34]|uniref:Translocator protein n=2 Tax=Pyricularia oryzae TaxID=318829 RepID=A0AA97NMJ0_PYRO3|nr:translocator protein [Pyricularia oryzae Y34]